MEIKSGAVNKVVINECFNICMDQSQGYHQHEMRHIVAAWGSGK